MSSTSTPIDAHFMARALRLAERGMYTTRPNPRVGCVLTRHDEILAEGFHHHAGGPHAERVALRIAGARARGATAYVTLEPCCHHGRTPPCAQALIDAGVARVVYAAGDPNPLVAGGGVRLLEAAGITVCADVLASEARRLNRGFWSRHARGRPFITLKLGMSLDGKVALSNGHSQWITSAEARADVQRLRARSCVVLTGSGTVLADNPRLTVRDPRFDTAPRPPARAVLDTYLRTPPSAQILTAPGVCHLFTTCTDGRRHAPLLEAGACIEVLPTAPDGLDLGALVARLAALEFNEVLVETGPTLAGSLLDAGLVDELIVYLAPVVLGRDARSAFATRALTQLGDAARWRFVEARPVGRDLRLTSEPASA
ncbi:MAG: bifunctional diaminohydroxyphosphoribosylaminopyrimidine deaminase/5-amino-6-(5-phosphoribosylamino)uracil reductase RibD [Gammaproteobacteria bacterium]|nr:bifunctional diaminohydroxyphosphoribosylaminopyrimidine deaminase/5-amino-6-(5-phosphoribosylamino)uracil reductase RibD [Gammaproteobacteria bacterium]